MFTNKSWDEIIDSIKKKNGSCLEVIIVSPFGPTAIKKNFLKGLGRRGINITSTINWWSASSSFGVLEMETEDGYKIYAVWCPGKENNVIKITPKSEIDLTSIIESLASSNVAPGVMRTFSHSRFPGG
jgi:hypothetical protein